MSNLGSLEGISNVLLCQVFTFSISLLLIFVHHSCQSLLRLKEPSVLSRCREIDVGLVESVLEDAKREYAEKAQVKAPEVAIDKHVYLPPPPSSAESQEPSCSGEVVLASEDGKIVCENTLDAQLDVVFRQKLPEIRKRLLGTSA